ncbi:MAG TPA: hypothetical protein VNF68_12420 [Candidatus Baltobacteraceae bacterium]|nr:hypothetical protein [Candidatus Baltobacteraceae bacterium]
MPYTKSDNRRPIHEPGSTPAAETREVRVGSTINYEIGDPRTLLMTDALQNEGFTRDANDGSLWQTQDREAFERMSQRVGAMKYFVLEPEKAKYAKEQLYEAGFTTRAWKFPFTNNRGDGKELYVVLRNADDYKKASTIANEAFRILPEQVEELKAAAARGALTDPISTRLFKESVEVLLDRAQTRELTQNDAKKAMRAVSPILPEQIEEVKILVAEGRLTEHNAKRPLDDASIQKLTQEQGYDLANAARKFATAKQRVQLTALIDLVRDGHGKRDEQALADGTIQERIADQLIKSKMAYVDEETRRSIEALEPGSAFETSAQRQQKMLDQLHGVAKSLGEATDYKHTKRAAYFIAAANAAGIVLRDGQGALQVASTKDTWMPDELVSKAVHTEGAEGPLIGSVVVVKGAKGALGRPQIFPSSQATLGGALALDDALAEAKAMGHTDPKVVEPTHGAAVTAWGVRDGYVAAVTKDLEIMVVPQAQFDGEPAFNATGKIATKAPAAAGGRSKTAAASH